MFSAEREFKISKRKKFNYLKAITEIWGGNSQIRGKVISAPKWQPHSWVEDKE